MTKTLRMGAAGAAIAFAMSMGGVAHAQQSASADAKVEVLKPLKIEAAADGLNFGSVIVDPAGGNISIAADGTLTCGNAFVCTGDTSVAEFTVTEGTIGKTVNFALPANAVLVQAGVNPVSGPANQKIELGSYVTNAAASADDANIYTVTLANNGAGEGNATFSIGGSLSFDGNELPGEYATEFSVTVEYS